MSNTVESEITKLNGLGYLVQNVCQTYGLWQFVFRSPFDWYTHRVEGATLLEAATNAATLAEKFGPAINVLKGRERRVRAPESPKRVRLKPSRVRL